MHVEKRCVSEMQAEALVRHSEGIEQTGTLVERGSLTRPLSRTSECWYKHESFSQIRRAVDRLEALRFFQPDPTVRCR